MAKKSRAKRRTPTRKPKARRATAKRRTRTPRTPGKPKPIRKRRGKTVKKVGFQSGRTNVDVDKRYEALPPGKRVSANGKVYWETRKNRSDLRDYV